MAISPMVAGATGPAAQITLTSDSGTSNNLTGATMNAPVLKNILTNQETTLAGTWTAINASSGVMQYQWAATDLTLPGSYWLYISYSLAGLIYKCDPIAFTILSA